MCQVPQEPQSILPVAKAVHLLGGRVDPVAKALVNEHKQEHVQLWQNVNA